MPSSHFSYFISLYLFGVVWLFLEDNSRLTKAVYLLLMAPNLEIDPRYERTPLWCPGVKDMNSSTLLCIAHRLIASVPILNYSDSSLGFFIDLEKLNWKICKEFWVRGNIRAGKSNVNGMVHHICRW